MKNIDIPTHQKDIHFITTPQGANYITCPFCNEWIDSSDDNYFENIEMEYCAHCKILFDLGCVYAELGCTDDIYYAKLVSKWEYNGEVHDGMILFDNYIELADNKIKILETICTCKLKL